MFNLLLMAFDRYASIVRPFLSRVYKTKSNTLVVIALSWILSFICNFGLVLGYEQHNGLRDQFESHVFCHVQYTEDVNLSFIIICFGYFVPVLVMCVLYILIWKHVSKRRQRMSSIKEGQVLDLSTKRKDVKMKTQKATRTIAMIVLVFIVTCLPNTLMLSSFVFTRKINLELSSMYKVGQILQCLNSTLNPLCYALGNPSFRKAIRTSIPGW